MTGKPRESGGPARLPVVMTAAVVIWLCFQSACVGVPREFHTEVRPEETAVVPESAPAWPLRVGIFNVWAIPLVSDETDERLAKMPDALAAFDADVLCMQEVWTGSAREKLVEGLAPSYVAARCDGGGLLVLSKLPILSERFTPFPPACDLPLTEWVARKGMLEIVVGTPAGPVRIVTAHLALAFGEANARTRQLHFLLDRLSERSDLPLVLAADLNTPPARRGKLFPDYLTILERGFTDTKPPTRLPDGTWDPGPPTRVGWPRETARRGYHPDQLLVRDGASGTVGILGSRITMDTPDTALSDHNLVLGELEIVRTE